jgi:hypothetical protein
LAARPSAAAASTTIATTAAVTLSPRIAPV